MKLRISRPCTFNNLATRMEKPMGRPRLTAEDLQRRGIGPGSPNWARYKDRISKENKPTAAVVAAPPKEPLRKSPPKYMDEKQRALWTKIVATAPAGALCACDEIAVELAVCLYQKLLNNQLKPSEAAQFKLILVSFGMFPAFKKTETPGATKADTK
ncbi:MAG TPA: hypothetical protein VGK01_11925 [Candidatus Angelobacter sp.]